MGKRIDQLILTAYHEAGHAVVARDIHLPMPVRVTIIPTSDALGRCQGDGFDAMFFRQEIIRERLAHVPCSVDANGRRQPIMARKQWRAALLASTEADVMATLAGTAAEWRRQRFSRFGAAYALGLALADPSDDLLRTEAQLQVFESALEERRRWLGLLWDRTWLLTGRSWRAIEAVAAALLKHKTLEGDALDSVLLARWGTKTAK